MVQYQSKLLGIEMINVYLESVTFLVTFTWKLIFFLLQGKIELGLEKE